MTKKLSKAELKFSKDTKDKIDGQARPNNPRWPWQDSNPIFIPKKSKKRK